MKRIVGTNGNDFIEVQNNVNIEYIIHGKKGNDKISVHNTGDNFIFGNEGNDFISGGSGNDFISGGKGKDKLFGLDGDDTILGGKGNDLISGGKGNDVLYGGKGKDTFVFELDDGFDIIKDFNPNKDKIVVHAQGKEDVSAYYNSKTGIVTFTDRESEWDAIKIKKGLSDVDIDIVM